MSNTTHPLILPHNCSIHADPTSIADIEPWRVGHVTLLAPDEDIPLVGVVRPGVFDFSRLVADVLCLKWHFSASTLTPCMFMLSTLTHAQSLQLTVPS